MLRVLLRTLLLAAAAAWAPAVALAEEPVPAENLPPPPRRAQEEAPAGPPRPYSPLRNVLWQTLPEEVTTVAVGPDGRAWHVLNILHNRAATVAEVRECVEREFDRPAPQVADCIPVLFEPGGRVWFKIGGRCLLGYDGRTWVERHPEKDGDSSDYFTAQAAGRKTTEEGSVSVYADGHAFFADCTGVHVFDGRAWTYEPFPSTTRAIDLAVAADGKAVAAFSRTRQAALRFWCGGTWTDVPADGLLGGAEIRTLVPWGGRVFWILTNTGQKRLWNLAAPSPADLAALVARLGGNAYRDREATTQALIDLGPAALPLLEKARTETRDPEIGTRLDRAAEAMKNPAGATIRRGAYEWLHPEYLGIDSAGRVYVGAEEIRHEGRPLGPGVAVVDRAGGVRVLPWGAAKGDRRMDFGLRGFKCAIDGGRRVWIAGCLVGRPARLLDLDTGTFVADAPDWRFDDVLGATPDGTVFLKMSWRNFDSVVGVCRPGATDDRTLLQAAAFPITGEGACVMSADGTVWADLADRGVARLENGQWQQAASGHSELRVDRMTPGRGRTLVARVPGTGDAASAARESTYVFFTPRGVRRALELRDLLAANQAEAAEAFRGHSLSPDFIRGREPMLEIAADKGGNLWVVHEKKLEVLAGGRWVEASGLIKAGRATEDDTVAGVAALGDGRRVYLSDFAWRGEKAQSFFGEVRQGQIVLEPASGWALHWTAPPVWDTQGAFWVYTPPSRQRPAIQPISRLMPDGVAGEVGGTGGIVLGDWGGNVWLAAPLTKGLLHVWRDGKIEADVRVPSFSNTNRESRLASDGPGSIWAWTTAGLYHLTADAPAAPARFAARAKYVVQGVAGRVAEFLCPPGGPLVIVTSQTRQAYGKQEWTVYLVPLPQ